MIVPDCYYTLYNIALHNILVIRYLHKIKRQKIQRYFNKTGLADQRTEILAGITDGSCDSPLIQSEYRLKYLHF
jgi:hypothetical protein